MEQCGLLLKRNSNQSLFLQYQRHSKNHKGTQKIPPKTLTSLVLLFLQAYKIEQSDGVLQHQIKKASKEE